MIFKKKNKCKKNGIPCPCENCLAEELHSKSLKALEETKKSISEVKRSMIHLTRAETLLKTGEFKIPLADSKKTA